MQDTAPENRTINVGTKLNARTVEVHVSDRGHGLPDEFEKQVFQPFVSSKAGGMGMGLAISDTIVQQHGGRLWAERNESGGATFRFTLPLKAQC